MSSQSCGAILELWEIDEDNTEPGLQNSNNNMLKFATRYTVTSGWKSWDLQDDEEGTSGEGDGAPFFLELYPPYASDINSPE